MTAPLRAFEQTLATYKTPAELGAAVHTLAQALVGSKLTTMTVFNHAKDYVRRVYSSNEAAYPVMGTKPMVRDAAFEAMQSERKIYTANSVEVMRPDFPDIDKIVALGCGAAINMPVAVGGQLIGTLNLLEAEGRYDPVRLEAVPTLILPASLAFLALRDAYAI